jgi:hypothetical protein
MIHLQRASQSVYAAVLIPWIYNQSAVIEITRRSGKLAQNQRARCENFRGSLHGFVVVARDVLVADQIHAVAGAGDEADVRGGVEGGELVWGDGFVEEVDWGVGDGAWYLMC